MQTVNDPPDPAFPYRVTAIDAGFGAYVYHAVTEAVGARHPLGLRNDHDLSVARHVSLVCDPVGGSCDDLAALAKDDPVGIFPVVSRLHRNADAARHHLTVEIVDDWRRRRNDLDEKTAKSKPAKL
jgi:hypothetical protein